MDKPPKKYDVEHRRRTYTPEHFEEDRKRRAAATKRWRTKYPERDKATQRRKYLEKRSERIEYAKRWKEAHKERVPDYARTHSLRKKYGMERADYDKLFAAQEGKCAICSKTQKQPLCVDHNHTTGQIRKLLCHNCNKALGLYQDDPLLLHKALKYLIEHST